VFPHCGDKKESAVFRAMPLGFFPQYQGVHASGENRAKAVVKNKQKTLAASGSEAYSNNKNLSSHQ
jgi:hypothetical protein